jgi:protoporphyrin/coproporphyrin ferrochelatase
LSGTAEPRKRYWPEPKPSRMKVWPAPFKVGSVGVLLVNLGTPDAPTASAIRRYLREFLSDPRVIEIPKLLWWPILNGPILLARPKKLVHRYASIWMDGGSPLLVYTKRQAEGVSRVLAERGHCVEVAVAMRYGKPSIREAINELHEKGCEHILTVPLYPQYASGTTATVVDEVTRVASHLRNQPAMRFIKRFHVDPAYIHPLADQIQRFWATNGRPQKLVMSFHGLPVRCTELGDPYCRDSYETARALADRLGLNDDDFLVTFQSRFGPAAWLQPYTEPTLEELAKTGVTKIDVVCPGFVADCLETLEEITVEVKDTFMAAGGEQFRYIPCLNDDPAWIDALTSMVEQHLQGWPTQEDHITGQ